MDPIILSYFSNDVNSIINSIIDNFRISSKFHIYLNNDVNVDEIVMHLEFRLPEIKNRICTDYKTLIIIN